VSKSIYVEIVYYGVGVLSFIVMVYNLVKHKALIGRAKIHLITNQYRFLTQRCCGLFYWVLVWPVTLRDGALLENPLLSSFNLTLIILIVLIATNN
jgi:hypothetical protein